MAANRPKTAPPTLYLASLGCAKAQVDAEAAIAKLVAAGYRLVDEPEGADLAVVNTCSFIRPAVEESIDTIVALGDLKGEGKLGELVVGGCLVDRYGDELVPELGEVDRFYGSGAFDRWAEQLGGSRPILASPGPALPGAADERILLNAPHYAYVKIAEGCDRACAFCTIPSIRGAQRSRPRADVLAELRQQAAAGVQEAVLVSQDTVRWGRDLNPKDRLHELVGAIEAAPDLPPWVRLHYLYPERFPAELVRGLAAGERIVPYVDVPIQHAADEVLTAMRRAHRRDHIDRLLDALREANPDVAVRTTVIVGHPGETPAHVDELCDYLERARFDAVGIFTYWDEEGTAAHALPGKVDEEEGHRRAAAIDEVAREVAEDAAGRFVGRELEVLVDGIDPLDGRTWIGRHPGQAPDVDGVVRLAGYSGPAGTRIPVAIEQTDGPDLIGRPAVAEALNIL